jgi:hypothetical protein
LTVTTLSFRSAWNLGVPHLAGEGVRLEPAPGGSGFAVIHRGRIVGVIATAAAARAPGGLRRVALHGRGVPEHMSTRTGESPMSDDHDDMSDDHDDATEKLNALQRGLCTFGDETLMSIAGYGFIASYLRQIVVGMRLVAPEEAAKLAVAADVLERAVRTVHANIDHPDELIDLALDTISRQRRSRLGVAPDPEQR